MIQKRKIIICLAGVMCRGERWGVHPAWAVCYAKLIAPLREKGHVVKIWAFNNIPPSIDGCPVPPDGGRSLFGRLDHYEGHSENRLDNMASRGRIPRLLYSTGLVTNPYGANITRVLQLHELVFKRLQSELDNTINQEDEPIVYLLSPDLVYIHGDLTKPAGSLSNTLWLMGDVYLVREDDPLGIENGWIAGGISTLCRFHEQRMANARNVRATYYENWLLKSLSGFNVRKIINGIVAGSHVHGRARCLRGRSCGHPWNWYSTRQSSVSLWNEVPTNLVTTGLKKLVRSGWNSGKQAVLMSLTWLPIEVKLGTLVSSKSIKLPGKIERVLRVYWCGSTSLCLRGIRKGLYLSRMRLPGQLGASKTFTEQARFTFKKLPIKGQAKTHLLLVSNGNYLRLDQFGALSTRPGVHGPKVLLMLDVP